MIQCLWSKGDLNRVKDCRINFWTTACLLVVVFGFCRPLAADQIVVSSREEFRTAIRNVQPDDEILLAPGQYAATPDQKWEHFIYADELNSTLQGTAEKPIVIGAADPTHPPEIIGWYSMTFVKKSHLIIRDLVIRNAGEIGLFLTTAGDHTGYDQLSSSNHITLENLVISMTGTGDCGNDDGIKVASTDHFAVRNVDIHAWGQCGGSAIDIVGSQYGIVENSRFSFPEREAWGSDTGVTAKMGSRDIKIRNNYFFGAGQESIQVGQDSGLQYFRTPPGTTLSDGTLMDYEAKDIEVYGNTIVHQNASNAPRASVMFMKSRDSRVHHNTIVILGSNAFINPFKIAATENDGLAKARNSTVDSNLIVFDYQALYWYAPFVGGSHPDHQNQAIFSFTFSNNAWYQRDIPSKGLHMPDGDGDWRDGGWDKDSLPNTDAGALYQLDPDLSAFAASPPDLTPNKFCIRSPDSRYNSIGAARCRSDGVAPARPAKLRVLQGNESSTHP